MKKELLASVLLAIFCFSCNTKENLVAKDLQTISTSTVAPERHEYWPLEQEVSREDTVLQLDDQYHVSTITHSLNDSAAIHTATDGMGEIIVHAHNWETKIEILKNQQPYIKAVLTRDIFDERDEAKELRHSGASFHKYKNGEFFFGIDACIPDTDVCDAAEVAIDQQGKIRVIRFHEFEEVEQ